MAKQFSCDTELQDKVMSGVNKLADYVSATLGPGGRNVILRQKDGTPIITKDGVTVANFVTLDEPFEDAGAKIVQQVSNRTNTECGDGTTTSIVLARELLKNSQKYIRSGYYPTEIKRGMDAAVVSITDYLKSNAKPINSLEDIEHIATISANNDVTTGKLVASAVDLAGKNGAVTIEDARSNDTTLEVIEGFIFDSGFASNQFINNERQATCRFEDSLLFITDHKLEFVEPVLPVLELAARENKPLTIIADEIEGQLLAALIMNTVRGSMKVVAIKAPRYGEERRSILGDLAVATGGTFWTRESGKTFKDFKLADFGRAKTVETSKLATTIVGGKGTAQAIQERIEFVQELVAQTNDMYECERLQQRITRLASGISIIRVGASSEVELVEKKHRIEDALEAIRSAQAEGIHEGGGVALIRASKNVTCPEFSEAQKVGFNIVIQSLSAPFRQMCKNCDLSADVMLDKVLVAEKGLNFRTGELVNLFDEGIIDPVKVTCSALKNSVSVVSTLITTNHAIVEK
jgi:chaperonin GroEL